MKRFALAGGLALACFFVLFAYAANRTPTPIVPPTETGEWDAMQQQVVDMARIKPGMGTLSLTVSASAASGTLNNAAGILTLASTTAGASGATPTVVTLTNSKVQAGDIVICELDQTGGTAATVLSCNPHVTAGQVVFTIFGATPTPFAANTVVLYYYTLTQGNPN